MAMPAGEDHTIMVKVKTVRRDDFEEEKILITPTERINNIASSSRTKTITSSKDKKQSASNLKRGKGTQLLKRLPRDGVDPPQRKLPGLPMYDH
jgi:hypothetical protein